MKREDIERVREVAEELRRIDKETGIYAIHYNILTGMHEAQMQLKKFLQNFDVYEIEKREYFERYEVYVNYGNLRILALADKDEVEEYDL